MDHYHGSHPPGKRVSHSCEVHVLSYVAWLGKRRVEKHRSVVSVMRPLDCSLFHFFPFPIAFDPLPGNLYLLHPREIHSRP